MESILGMSVDDVVNFFERFLRIFKNLMAWLGIFVLPEEDGTAPDDAAGE